MLPNGYDHEASGSLTRRFVGVTSVVVRRPFHDFLRDELRKRGLTQTQLAAKLGHNSHVTVNRWCSGVLPMVGQLPLIAEALDMDPVALFASVEWPIHVTKQEPGEDQDQDP